MYLNLRCMECGNEFHIKMVPDIGTTLEKDASQCPQCGYEMSWRDIEEISHIAQNIMHHEKSVDCLRIISVQPGDGPQSSASRRR